MRKNVLRELIREGRLTLGTHANLDNPTIVELIGHSGMLDARLARAGRAIEGIAGGI